MNPERPNPSEGYGPSIVAVSGHAKTPPDCPEHQTSPLVSALLLVDRETSIITDAYFSHISPLLNSLLISLVRGHDLNEGITPVVNTIRRQVLLPVSAPIIQALRVAHARYAERQGLIRPLPAVKHKIADLGHR